MGKWLFVTGTSRGSYTVVEPDGEHREVVGLNINLGESSGETVNEALQALLDKLSKSKEVPETLFKKQKLIAYKIEDGEWIDIKKQLGKAETEDIVEETTTVYENIKCKWCSEALPKNGAAQFSHLKKHLKQLLSAGKITKEQFDGVRKLQLADDMTNILITAKAEGLFIQTPSPASGPTPKTEIHK